VSVVTIPEDLTGRTAGSLTAADVGKWIDTPAGSGRVYLIEHRAVVTYLAITDEPDVEMVHDTPCTIADEEPADGR
jgi:hypothetical protein